MDMMGGPETATLADLRVSTDNGTRLAGSAYRLTRQDSVVSYVRECPLLRCGRYIGNFTLALEANLCRKARQRGTRRDQQS